METSECEVSVPVATHQPAHPPDSLFDRCSWFYALCREYLFRDHTQEMVELKYDVWYKYAVCLMPTFTVQNTVSQPAKTGRNPTFGSTI